MKDELKKSVQHYLTSKALNQRQMKKLEKLMSASQGGPSNSKPSRSNMFVAVLVIALVSSVFWLLNLDRRGSVAELIAEEVAYNHLKMKPMEVVSGSIDNVRAYFTKLDFSLSQSKFIADNRLKLIGGRYCTIQGESAAQLRMENEKTGDIQTVYQAPYNKELFRDLPKLHEGHAPVRHFINGVAVDLWVENGVLFARSFSQ